ncbi:hypothetical protein, partial [Mesorhizobium sp.]|uniref:hypothetical protein n=1 Tax=Mesorhizobium sp. TaxID=1871066 RepID=UPI0025C3E5AA
LAVAGSRRIMCLEGKAAVRFLRRFSRQNAQLVGGTKQMIMLPYRSFCPLYEKWPFSSIKIPQSVPGRRSAQSQREATGIVHSGVR